MPYFFRKDLKHVFVHDGSNPWGGGYQEIIIHQKGDKMYREFWNGNVVIETLMHEAAHAVIDRQLRKTDEWNAAVAADGLYVSDYGREFNHREDIAETSIIWFATRHAKNTMTECQLEAWEKGIGNRLRLFDSKFCQPGMQSPYEDCIYQEP